MTKLKLCVVSQPARPPEVKNTLSGIVDALSHRPAWAGALATSEIDQRVVFRSEPPFGAGALAGAPVRQRGIDQIRLWFEDVTGTAVAKAGLPAGRPPSSKEIFPVTTSPLQGDCS